MEEGSSLRLSEKSSLKSPKKNSEDDFIKPIRLAKRQDHKQDKQDKQGGKQDKQDPEEFQCRPIRLSSKSSNRDEGPPLNQTSPKSKNGRRRSIQIKNLPIVEQATQVHEENSTDDMIFAICVVDFHHVRGPEIQWWKSNYYPEYNAALFKQLPFQALPDGSHLFEETFSNFNLVYDFHKGVSIDDYDDLNKYDSDPRNLKTLFGCSCVRQIKTTDLSNEERERNKDITRSIVQKAVVVIARKQPIFTKIKEKLSIIAQSYFLQDTFNNFEVLENLFANLNASFKLIDNEVEIGDSVLQEEQKYLQEEEFFVNLNLKNTILNIGSVFLIVFKSLLLEKKVVIFSNNNIEMLTQFQNNLISLIPNLINSLDDSGCALIDYVETNGPLKKPNSLNTTNRKSMLRFFGLPLQIFNTKGSFWTPYLPLQQIEELKTKSYMVGCSNLLIVNQAERFKIDVLINLDTNEVSFPSGKLDELHLSHNDKKFINNLIKNISEENSEFFGNDDHIRYQFEDYLCSLISTYRFYQYVERFKQDPPGFDKTEYEVGNLAQFHVPFVDAWSRTNNFKIWDMMADEFIFNFIDPRHVGAALSDSLSNKLTSLFQNFRIKAQNIDTSDTKVQKFLPETEHSKIENSEKGKENDENLKEEENENEKEASPISKRISSWGWGFKTR
ncbi:uncharacterized protein PRCAT00006307001 [Priceomyces carsonii]|uniref:uncharacterized protein n=1 Tax=Priceomyces carsonii TaxID=28549 RepID=UPI002ED99DCA|nr:unnamed protein product [Priceomyces carsonii]